MNDIGFINWPDLCCITDPLKMPMLNVSKEKGRTPWEIFPGVDSIHGSNDASLFSSSVPVLLHEKRRNTFMSLLLILHLPIFFEKISHPFNFLEILGNSEIE